MLIALAPTLEQIRSKTKNHHTPCWKPHGNIQLTFTNYPSIESLLPYQKMGTLQLSSYALSSFSTSLNFNYITNSHKTLKTSKHPRFSRGKIRAVAGTIPENESQSTDPEEPPFVAFAFVSVSWNILYMHNVAS